MIPLRDSIQSHHRPLVNYLIIAICSAAFIAQVTSHDGGQTIIEQFGMVPVRLTDPSIRASIVINQPIQTPHGIVIEQTEHVLADSPLSPWLTLLTSMFLHGGWMHFLGNMWFLYVFGDNVEDRFGHLGYLAMYIGTGIAAGASHWVTNDVSPIPTVGASGAIAGVMGAYLLLYPHAKVLAVLPIFILFYTFVMPAPVFLAIWFAFQIFSGISSSGASTGVAWWAHIGGFIAGAILAIVVRWTAYGRTETTDTRRAHRF